MVRLRIERSRSFLPAMRSRSVMAGPRSALDALAVLARARVDAQEVAFVDEQRHVDLAPVSSVAGFCAPPEVSPLMPGSDEVTRSSTKFGSVTPMARPFQNSTNTTMLSLSHFQSSPTRSLTMVICS